MAKKNQSAHRSCYGADMKASAYISLLAAAALLSACASDPTPLVASSGTLPAGGTYGSALGGEEGNPLLDLVGERLAAQGLERGQRPSYILQAAYSERPGAAGLFVPRTENPQWLQPPQPRRKKAVLAQVTISLSDAASGREVYRVSVTEPLTSRPRSESMKRLIEAAFTNPEASGSR